MIERAIVATDLSEASDAMVKHLIILKDIGISSILLLQCQDYQEVTSEVFPYVATIQNEAMERQKRILEEFGFTVEGRISPGNAKREINRIAQEEDYPLVVVGSQGRSLIAGAFLGGVAHEVMVSTRKPLLIIRLTVNEERKLQVSGLHPDGLASNILYATDFSPGAQEAFLFLEQIVAAGTGKSVTLLHVQDRKTIEPHLLERLDEFNTIDRQHLEQLKDRLLSQGIPRVVCKVVYGDPYAEILREIQDSQSSLVIMGTQGKGFLRELFVGSVSQYIARRAEVPVLLVPIAQPE